MMSFTQNFPVSGTCTCVALLNSAILFIFVCLYADMTDSNSTENATPPKPTTSRYLNASVPIQMKPKFQFECAPRGNEESEFFDLVDFGEVAFSLETITVVFIFIQSPPPP